MAGKTDAKSKFDTKGSPEKGAIGRRNQRVLTACNAVVDSGLSTFQIMTGTWQEFLALNPLEDNKYHIYRTMYKISPEIGLTVDAISMMVNNSFRGFKLKEGYTPSQADFLQKIQQLAAEVNFATKLDTLISLLVINGDVIYRLHRDATNAISSVELLATDAVTIIDSQFQQFPASSKMIRSRDFYRINEEANFKQDETDTGSSKVDAELNKVAQPNLIESQDETEFYRNKYEIINRDILHFSLHSEGNLELDSMGRKTFGVWGISPLDALIATVKWQWSSIIDYMRWIKTGMPRQDISIEMGDIGENENYAGSAEDREKSALETAKDIIAQVEESLFRKDEDEHSPTYGKMIPIETDRAYIHTSDVTVNQTGGKSPTNDIFAVLKKCDQAICSKLGVPITMLGYEESNYAVGYITKSFMLSFGGGLLKTLKDDFSSFAKSEFAFRQWNGYTSADFDAVELDYFVDDSEEETAKTNARKTKSDMVMSWFLGDLVPRDVALEELGLKVIGGDLGAKYHAEIAKDNAVAQTGGWGQESSQVPMVYDSNGNLVEGAGTQADPNGVPSATPDLIHPPATPQGALEEGAPGTMTMLASTQDGPKKAAMPITPANDVDEMFDQQVKLLISEIADGLKGIGAKNNA